MSHTKDIDERNQSAAASDDPGLGNDLMLVDLLYGELDGNERERAERRVREDDALAGELEALSRIRSIMRELPDEEPPEALSTKLLHAAAAEVSGNRAPVVRDEERLSVWDRMRRLFMPLVMHPGLAAAASVILIGGVAGMLYVSNNLKVASPVAREAGQAASQADEAELPAVTSPAAPAAQPDFGSPQAGAPPPTGAVAVEDPRATDAVQGRGGERRQALDEARDTRSIGGVSSGSATHRPPTNTELALADDYGAEEQSQGYFAQAPAEEPEPGSLARQEKGGKAGRASSASGSGDTAGLIGLDKNAAPSDEARQKKEAESYRLAQPTSPKSKARSRDDDGAGYDELASQLETGSSAGARSGNAPGASGGAAGGAPPQATPAPAQAAPAAPGPVQPAPAKTAPARKPSPERAPAPPPPAADRAADAEADAEAGAPAEGKKAAARKAASNEASKERERKDTAARVLSLHKQALAAAARGDCATARTNMNTILRLDSTYHREYVARDARLQDCLAVKK